MNRLNELNEIKQKKIFNDVQRIVAKSILCDKNVITLESTIDELKIDSLDILEIAFEIEDIYNIDIVGNDVIKMHNIKDMVEIVFALENQSEAKEILGRIAK